jgi:crossover junction endodeoxyribonuclease RuvC
MDALICGIDPGLGTTGYGILRVDGDHARIVDAGICTNGGCDSLAARLAALDGDITCLLGEHEPTVVAVEDLYSHYRHPKTAVLMGHARGVILAAAARRCIEVHSISATRVKKLLTGNGRAGKEQVQAAIRTALRLENNPEPADVADALAVALCCAHDLSRCTALGTKR